MLDAFYIGGNFLKMSWGWMHAFTDVPFDFTAYRHVIDIFIGSSWDIIASHRVLNT